MKNLWLYSDPNAGLVLGLIEHPYFRLASAADMWTSNTDGPENIPTKAIQFMRNGNAELSRFDGQRLIFVLSGGLASPSFGTNVVSGDTLLLMANVDLAAAFIPTHDCHLLVLHVGDWAPKVIAHEKPLREVSPGRHHPNFKWLFTGADEEAYFADFTEMFDDGAGWGATAKKAYATMLVEQGDGFFMDWHPEGANNIVVVTYGCLELEAAPDRIERFYPGDVCFAVDRTGKGHIDRARGATGLATIVIPSKTFQIPTL